MIFLVCVGIFGIGVLVGECWNDSKHSNRFDDSLVNRDDEYERIRCMVLEAMRHNRATQSHSVEDFMRGGE